MYDSFHTGRKADFAMNVFKVTQSFCPGKRGCGYFRPFHHCSNRHVLQSQGVPLHAHPQQLLWDIRLLSSTPLSLLQVGEQLFSRVVITGVR